MQNYVYPSSSNVTITGSTNGTPIPTTSIVVGGENAGGNTEPLQLDSSGNLLVAVSGSALPAGAATSANQVIENGYLLNIQTYTGNTSTSLAETVVANGSSAPGYTLQVGIMKGGVTEPITSGSATSANSIPVVIASDQAALPLPTGAATSANQTTEINLITTRLTGSLVPTAFDEIDLTYIVSGNGTGQIGTAVYKLASVTVKTLTLTYDSSNRLSTVVAS